MSPRVWWRARRVRRLARNVPTWRVDELASLIVGVRRPKGVES